MKTSIGGNFEINYENWVKKTWRDEEAACLLTQVNPDICIERNPVYHNMEITNNSAECLFKDIKLWSYIGRRSQNSPFWYIDKAIKEGIPVPDMLLRAVKKHYLNYLPRDREKFLYNYRYIARELDLKIDDISISRCPVNETVMIFEKPIAAIEKEEQVKAEAKKMLSEQGKSAVRQSSKFQNNQKLKMEALRLHKENSSISKRQSSIKISPKLNEFAIENKIPPLSAERCQQTIYNWILSDTT